MARARLLKPGFFKNEELAKLSFAHRLTFAGLWTLADREGRLEDRPVRIKAELFPYDPVDVEGILADLAAQGFIQRYAYPAKGSLEPPSGSNEPSSGSRVLKSATVVASTCHRAIFIPTFPVHQTPHHREPASRIPAPRSRPRKRKTEAQGQPRASLGPDVGQPESSLSDPETVTGDPVTGDPVTGDPETVCAALPALFERAETAFKKTGELTAQMQATVEGIQSRTKEFISWFQAEYKARRHGADYLVNWKKDGPNVKRMLHAVTFPQLQDDARIMLSDKCDDSFIKESDRGIGMLSMKFNWLNGRRTDWELLHHVGSS